MDCTIIPFKYTTLTKSIYPLKINEYLAAGKAVIASNFSEDISGFKDVIYLSEKDEDFLENIDRAINENSGIKIQERIAKAQENTWEARVKSFWEILGDYYNKKNEDVIVS
jgi:glycosyltransferase involved in cell wall biosynthesis